MSLSHLLSGICACAWGIKDLDFTPFCIGTARRELALDRSGLDQLVLTRLKRILLHAEQTSTYYAKIFSEYGVSAQYLNSCADLRKFPCLSREAMRERIPEIISGGSVLPSWGKRATGGTTSSPVTFFCDSKALWRKYAFSKVFDGWYGTKTGERVAYLWGAAQDFNNKPTFGMRLRNFTYQHSMMLPSAPLDDEILAGHYRKLLHWQPRFLQAYPTPLYELCVFMRKHNLCLPSLKAVSVTAETLFDAQRRMIEETFGFKIYNWYGSRELAKIASECECHAGFHVNEPCVYVEIEPDSTLPDGCGHLIVTDLLNRATPLIRYRTGDIAAFVDGECLCGRPLRRISALTGRVTDLVVLPDGRKVRLTNRFNFQEITEMQIVQRSSASFLVRFVRGPKFSQTSLDDFLETFYTAIDMRVVVFFEELEKIPRERSGKIRFVVNEMHE